MMLELSSRRSVLFPSLLSADGAGSPGAARLRKWRCRGPGGRRKVSFAERRGHACAAVLAPEPGWCVSRPPLSGWHMTESRR